MEFQILHEFSEVEALSEEWDQLLERSPCNRAFSSATWYLAACQADPPAAPYVVTVRKNGRLTGLLPLVLRDQIATFANRLADYQDLVGEADDLESLTGLLRFALASGSQLAVTNCRQDANLVRAIRGLEPEFRCEGFNRQKECCHIKLEGDFEDYLASRSYMFRKQLRRAQRKAERDGVSVREVSPQDLSPDRLPDIFLDLHLGRFSEKSCFNRPTHEAFVKSALPSLFRQKRLKVFCLFHEERRVGIDLYMVGRSSMGNWNAGYLEEMSRWSPGKLMLAAAINTALDEGLAEVDLLTGTQPWKLSWATGQHHFGEMTLPVPASTTHP